MQINQLPNIPQAPADADVLAIEANGVTYKVSKSVLASAILGTIDTSPTQSSTRLVQSGGVYTAIQQSTALVYLTASDDLNNLPRTGFYSSTDSSSRPANNPINANFHLIYLRTNSNIGAQIYISNDGYRMLYRVGYTSGWQPWQNVTTTADIRVKSVTGTMAANSTSASLAATLGTGETFVGWLNIIPVSWSGALWPVSNEQTTTVYTNAAAVSSARTVRGFYLVK